MRRPVRTLFLAVIAGLLLTASALAQSSSNQPSPGGVGQQFNSGANRVGQGAAEIGEGIKQGAIMTWQALRDGANAVADRFSGDRAASGPDRNQSAQQPP
jgi:hypothetical protein